MVILADKQQIVTIVSHLQSVHTRTGAHESLLSRVMRKKVLLYIGTYLLLFSVVAIIREWNHNYSWQRYSKEVRHKAGQQGQSTHPSKLPLQDKYLSRESRISAASSHFDPVSTTLLSVSGPQA